MKTKILLFVSFLCASFYSSFQNDCAPGSLDELDLVDLLESSNKNVDCLNEARNAFSKKYATTHFSARGPFDKNGAKVEDDHRLAPNSNIILKDYDMILYFLSNFGNLMTTFSISFRYIPLDQGKEIIQRLNDIRLATLEWLYLHECYGNVLFGLNAFEDVKRLKFSSSLENERLEIEVHINELFPNLFTLSVEDTKTIDWTFIDGNLPHLKVLEIELPWNNVDNIDASDIVNFFKSNAQIDTLTVTYVDLNILKEIAANLHNLEELKLIWLSENYLNYNGDTIHIRSVEDLTIDLRIYDEIPEKVNFDGLETLTLNIMLREADKWTEFLANQVHKGLSKFNLFYDELTYKQLTEIPQNIPDLRNLEIECKSEFGAKQILDFLKKSKITHFKIQLQMNESERNRLKDNIPGNWTSEMDIISGKSIEVLIERPETDEPEIVCNTEGVPSSNEGEPVQESAEGDGSNGTNVKAAVMVYSIHLVVIVAVIALIKWL